MNLDWELCELSQKYSVLSQQKGNKDISLFPRMYWLCLTPTYHQVLHLISTTESLREYSKQRSSLFTMFTSKTEFGESIQ